MGELDIKSTTIERGLDLIWGFLGKAIGPTVEEFGLGLSDNLRMRRFRNQLKNLERAKKIAEDHNVNIKQINLKALFPYLEGAVLEEDETLQEMWANLFVNYVDTAKNLTMTVFPDILRHLSSNEVKIISFMRENTSLLKKNRWYGETQNYPGEYTDEEIGNLSRLGLIHAESNLSIYDENKIEEWAPDNYYLTNLGRAFLDACQR